MQMTLNIDYLVKKKIEPNVYVLYLILKNGSVNEMRAYVKRFGLKISDLDQLVKAKILDTKGKEIENLTIEDISEHYNEREAPEHWVNDFIDLWPRGAVNAAGYYVKGNKRAILPKLNSFIKKYPEYATKDLILTATKNYLSKQARGGFAMCKIAPWFIEKDNISILSGECQALIDQKETPAIPSTDLV